MRTDPCHGWKVAFFIASSICIELFRNSKFGAFKCVVKWRLFLLRCMPLETEPSRQLAGAPSCLHVSVGRSAETVRHYYRCCRRRKLNKNVWSGFLSVRSTVQRKRVWLRLLHQAGRPVLRRVRICPRLYLCLMADTPH